MCVYYSEHCVTTYSHKVIVTYIVALDNGTQYIRDIMDDQFSKDEMTEAIKHCNMDAAAALNHLIEKGIASLRMAII